MTQTTTNQFLEERRRTRRFFNRMSPLYPIVERHLFPEYRRALERIGLSPELCVLDLATGTGLLAGAFSERDHVVRCWRRTRRSGGSSMACAGQS